LQKLNNAPTKANHVVYHQRTHENNPNDLHRSETTFRYDEEDNRTSTDHWQHGPFPTYPLRDDLINLKKAIEYHNRGWDTIHKIYLPQEQIGAIFDELRALEMD
jgi:hypothetical protein